jgi:hypothetical protein
MWVNPGAKSDGVTFLWPNHPANDVPQITFSASQITLPEPVDAPHTLDSPNTCFFLAEDDEILWTMLDLLAFT